MTASDIGAGCIVARDGRTLAVRVSGPRDAMPVVLLHGQIHTAACWSRIMAGTLAQDHRLIAPDLAGHGGSDPPDFANGDWMADDLADVLAALGVDDPVLVGWSFGSAVAATYAASGRRVRGLVPVGAGTRAGRARPRPRPDPLTARRRRRRDAEPDVA